MELRLLRSFLVVAQELNIGKAAKRLFIAQPPLSKQIQQLESELGIQLFDRIPKGVKLTSAGEQLVGEAKKILLTVDQAVAIVNKVGNGSQGLLQFGFSGAIANSALPKMIRSIHAHYPGIEARIKRKPNSSVVLDQVISGEIDAGLVLLPIKYVGIKSLVISTHHLIVALPSDHALVAREEISLFDLKEERFITNVAYKGSVIREVLIDSCIECGFNPKIAQEADDTFSILALVGAGIGVTLTLNGLEGISNKDVVFKPLKDATRTVQMAVVWREENQSNLLKNAIDACRYNLS